jgi:hypothetical protein
MSDSDHTAQKVRSQKGPSTRPTKPDEPNVDIIPEELKARRQWVVWRYEIRDERWTKIPYQPAHPKWKAKADDPTTWSTFDAAWQAYLNGGFDGVGYEFSTDDPYFGVDFDNCLSGGEVAPWVLPYVEMTQPTYGEVSPSGKGIKFVGRGKLPEDTGTRKKGFGPDGEGAIELYDHGRFFALTGNVFGDSSAIVELPEAAATLYRVVKPEKTRAKHQAGVCKPVETIPGLQADRNGNGHHPTDDEVLRLIGKSKDSAKFDALWSGQIPAGDSPSEADSRLANLLVFYCGRGNEDQARRLFLESELGKRDKAQRQDYMDSTFALAQKNRTDYFDWDARPRGGSHSGNGHAGSKGNKDSQPRSGDQAKDDRPEILITTDEKHVNDLAVKALVRDQDLYRLGYLLATILRDGDPPRGVEYLDGPPPQIATIEPATLRERMASTAQWQTLKKIKANEFEKVPAHPPDWSVQAVFHRGVWRGIRPIVGVVESPTMRPDGSILSTPGYDPATRLFYRPNAKFEPVPESPSKADAEAARDELLDLVAEFPFKDENHKAVWLAALLTVISRASFSGEVPLFAFDGNCPGSGKSKLVDLISLIASGRRMPRMVWPSGFHADDEIRKRITSLALGGERFVLLDNVDSALGGAPIDAALTGESWEDRLLCTNKTTGALPLLMTWFASGNNIRYRGDFIRRALPCRLESALPNPENRSGFKYPDLKGHALANRAKYIRSALVILRASRVFGNPAILPPLGSFEIWTHAIGDPVVWITGKNVFDVRPSIKASDHNAQVRLALVLGWADLPDSDTGLTVAKAIEILRQGKPEHETLRSALLEISDKAGEFPSVKSIGKHLSAIEGRNVGDETIGDIYIRAVPNRTGVNLWKVERKAP